MGGILDKRMQQILGGLQDLRDDDTGAMRSLERSIERSLERVVDSSRRDVLKAIAETQAQTTSPVDALAVRGLVSRVVEQHVSQVAAGVARISDQLAALVPYCPGTGITRGSDPQAAPKAAEMAMFISPMRASSA